MAGPEVGVSFEPGLGHVTLNRAPKMNALNLNMIRLLHEAVDEIDRRKGTVGCVLFEGAGGKAFCAGGDVARVQQEAKSGGSLPNDFFFEEYAVVHRLVTMLQRTGSIQVTLWNGVTMGGGVGLTAHGPIRIVTETTVFAKPEMNIGLFPDVGSTRLLGNLKNASMQVGMYLGVTGARLTAWDCLQTGLATHFLPSAKIPELRAALVRKLAGGALGTQALALIEEAIQEVGQGAQPDAKKATLTNNVVAIIDRCFDAETVEQIVANLEKDPSDFAKATLKTMRASCSPISCKVSLKAIRMFMGRGDQVSWGTVLETEYRLSQRFTLRPQPKSDFWEGIRAVLLDKDRKQRWSPGWDELEKITDADVDFYFSPLEPGHRRGELVLTDPSSWGEAERKANWDKFHPKEIVKASPEILAKL